MSNTYRLLITISTWPVRKLGDQNRNPFGNMYPILYEKNSPNLMVIFLSSSFLKRTVCTPDMALTTVDFPCATWPMVPMLMVACLLMTSGERAVNFVTSLNHEISSSARVLRHMSRIHKCRLCRVPKITHSSFASTGRRCKKQACGSNLLVSISPVCASSVDRSSHRLFRSTPFLG